MSREYSFTDNGITPEYFYCGIHRHGAISGSICLTCYPPRESNGGPIPDVLKGYGLEKRI